MLCVTGLGEKEGSWRSKELRGRGDGNEEQGGGDIRGNGRMNGGLQWKSALRIPCPLAEPGREALQTAVWEEESDTWAITTRGGGSPSWLTRLLQSGALPRKWELPPSLCPAHTTALTACSNSWLSAEISGSSCLHRTLTSIMSPDSTLSSPPVQQGLFHL